MQERKKKSRKLKIYSALIFLVAFIGLMFFLFSGGNYKTIQTVFREDMTSEEIQETLGGLGYRGYVTLGSLSMLQVVLTFIPAEPVQVISGLAFGFLRGGVVCIAGVFVGNTIIYILYKLYGHRLTEWFEHNAEFDFEAAKNSPKVAIIIFILYFLPAIPYGLICFFTASLDIKYPKYILLTTLGAIPSVAIGVGLGHLALAASWILSVCVFFVLVVLLVILYKKKSVLFKKINAFMKENNGKSDTITVRKCNGFVYKTVSFCSGLYLGGKVKVKMENKVGKLQRPSIVLVTHGSFLDFIYAGKLLEKEKPNFVTARLYFYKKALRKIMLKVGTFPKSMFCSDLENVKNCLKVLSAGRVLAMMPEARLSTVGRFEGIQDSTYKFIKKMNVPVYTIRLEGGYFAKPKWGDKVRKGAVVHATLDTLYTQEQVSALSLEEMQQGIEQALYYDEFKWLEGMPNVRYKSKTLAVGLENILTTCPNCGAKYSIATEGMQVKCTQCSLTATLDDRYAFVDGKPFHNFAEWYDWQKEEMEKEIRSNPEFKLEHKVTLKHSSKDGKKMLRVAGEGVCTFDKSGFVYRGTRDGEGIEKRFLLKDIYRLLFGAGEDFEIYEGKEIWYFVPEESRCCVDYYVASELLKKVFIS